MSTGKSGSLFYYTKDRNYLIKTLPEREFTKLRSILRAYLEHLTNYPDSLIARFFGMYKIVYSSGQHTCGIATKSTCYIVIMDNLFKSFSVDIRFDLKGSVTGRTRLRAGISLDDYANITTALKDNDFRLHI